MPQTPTEMAELHLRMYLESIRRTDELCRAIMQKAAEADPLGMLDSVGDFLNSVDAVDDEGIALWERGRTGLLSIAGVEEPEQVAS